jgi:hypothetical protein
MVFVSDGTPEGDKEAQRLNVRTGAIDDQTRAHIRDFYGEMTAEEKADFRAFLAAYVRLGKNRLYLARFAVLLEKLGSLPTNDQLLAIVDSIEPLEV